MTREQKRRVARVGRSMGYSERDREGHYGATVAREKCLLCLMGMGASHGYVGVEWRASRDSTGGNAE